jgi:hypothetical protein
MNLVSNHLWIGIKSDADPENSKILYLYPISVVYLKFLNVTLCISIPVAIEAIDLIFYGGKGDNFPMW